MQNGRIERWGECTDGYSIMEILQWRGLGLIHWKGEQLLDVIYSTQFICA